MLIEESTALAEALRPLLIDQVVVRYAMQNDDHPRFDAELAVLVHSNVQPVLLVHAVVLVHLHHSVEIDSILSLKRLDERPGSINDLCRRWTHRPFDDWLHDKPFMGTYPIFRDGGLYTSIKLDAIDDRWRFLTGVILGELQKFEVLHSADDYEKQGIKLLQKRFAAFAAQNERVWANRVLTAR